MADRETTGIVIRTDIKPVSDKTDSVHYFCATCDPEGKGVGFGLICSKESYDTEKKIQEKYQFCSHCGRRIDYTNRKERTHYMSY